jgi:2-keto-4-pentenoate hydratase/2-oxohepta-3-ene-1,7-dioic acid hydratase in catechol pathway
LTSIYQWNRFISEPDAAFPEPATGGPLKLATFTHDGSARVGVIAEDGIVDLRAEVPSLPCEMSALLALGSSALALRPPKFLAVGLNYADHVAEAKVEIPKVPTLFNKQSASVTGSYGEIGNPHGLRIRTWVNDEVRQDSNTKELIFDCFALVEHRSTAFTLEPGDVVATGTPSGVGIAIKPPRLLQVGDRVRVEIEGIGAIENRSVPEPATSSAI